MSSKRETVLLKVIDILEGTTGVSDRIYRSRIDPLALKEFPALNVRPLSESADRPNIARITWTLTFEVLVMIRGDEPDALSDSVIADVHQKILSDTTLDGLCVDLEPISLDWQLFPSDQPLGLISMQFRATYQTSFANIES